MRVVILDPYFDSLGGGEKVVVVMAEHLAKKHDVTIVVKKPVDKDFVNKYFNVDLGKVNFIEMPQNSLFFKIIANRFIRMPGRWKSIFFDGSSLRAIKKLKPDLFINSLYQSSLPSPAPKSIYICMFPQKLKPYKHLDSTIKKIYNSLTTILEDAIIGSREDAINSYSVIVSNSKYTSGWIQKYWNKKSVVLYPVCDDMGPALKKEKIILSVGRFFADNGSSHHKKHDELIKAFIKLNRNDWQLDIAGSISDDKESKEYLEYLKKLSKGHKNIHIYPNMPFKDLKNLRQRSSIYWHATGYGYDVNLFPENQEHFGMVTVEAMSAGVVPVVYKSAGQEEVVTDMKDGLLWENIDELVKKTGVLIDDNKLLVKLQKTAIKRSVDFSREVFELNLDTIVEEL